MRAVILFSVFGFALPVFSFYRCRFGGTLTVCERRSHGCWKFWCSALY